MHQVVLEKLDIFFVLADWLELAVDVIDCVLLDELLRHFGREGERLEQTEEEPHLLPVGLVREVHDSVCDSAQDMALPSLGLVLRDESILELHVLRRKVDHGHQSFIDQLLELLVAAEVI